MNVNRIYRDSSLARKLEPVTMPSMCENMHIPTIGDIFHDYCRGIVRPDLLRNTYADEGDDLVITHVAEDLTDLNPDNPLALREAALAAHKKPKNKGSDPKESSAVIIEADDDPKNVDPSD